MGNIVDFCNYLPRREVIIMCKILKKIHNMGPDELLKQYDISTEPPIDITTLLKEIGIATIKKDFTEIEEVLGVKRGAILGAAFSNNDKLGIFYKESDSILSQKFTIAHELAHCCLHCCDFEAAHIEYRLNCGLDISYADEEKEREANIFAERLLIPKDKLEEIYNKMIIPSLKQLSVIFKVAPFVMAARLDNLDLPYYKDCEVDINLL